MTRLVEGGELSMAEDGGLDFGWLRPWAGCSRAGLHRQTASRRTRETPASRRQAHRCRGWGCRRLQVGVDILQVFRLGAVDVARQVEVEVVGLDLGQRHHARILGRFRPAG